MDFLQVMGYREYSRCVGSASELAAIVWGMAFN
jgi:hypothetical protein